MMHFLAAVIMKNKNEVRAYLAAIGKRVAIREAKRAAIKAGKAWPPRDHKLLKLR
jgi:hypothetical protein